MIRVARNRIIDRFRKARTQPSSQQFVADQDDDHSLDLPLPDVSAGPKAVLARSFILTRLQQALKELPPDQRDVFVAHEIDGLSFNEIAANTGTAVTTLLARKRYAVLRLRRSLQSLYDELDN